LTIQIVGPKLLRIRLNEPVQRHGKPNERIATWTVLNTVVLRIILALLKLLLFILTMFPFHLLFLFLEMQIFQFQMIPLLYPLPLFISMDINTTTFLNTLLNSFMTYLLWLLYVVVVVVVVMVIYLL
jgi:hypothetical protein